MVSIRSIRTTLFFIILFCLSSACFAQSLVTYDLGAGVGSYNNNNYTEADFGVNYFALPYLAWRNDLFYRFNSNVTNQFGIDTSARFVGSLGNSALGLSAFAGPGYHFVNQGINAPFIELGAILQVAHLNIGGGVKTILNSAVQTGAPNDTEVFLMLSGGGVF